ncbi:MAG: DNA recombination protein RmuC [Oscillospiraceae bacterium]|nr:DNA recombination protein RmuC [Oscillospiraceae bacterium]
MIYVVLVLTALCAVLLIVLLLGQRRRIGDEVYSAVARSIGELGGSVKDMTESGMLALAQVGRTLETGQQRAAEYQAEGLRSFEERTGVLLKGQTAVVEKLREGLTGQIDRMDRELTEDQRQLNETVRDRLAGMQTALEQGVRSLREETGRKLDEIRGTVDEKLQSTLEKRITESFRTVSEQLEQVYRGLGEMQTLAEDVGGLKKVLAGVKTRGILGEVQLGAILEEVLSPEQYDTNVATVPGSAERVEYAVRLPGRDGTVYLPIDAKFPGERYAQLAEARERGDRAEEDEARKALMTVLRAEARDIHDKYIEVPYTTGFGVMFLPFEGLYAEAVNSGLIEELQRDWKISVAGPSTMAALLNSLQMGFRTLAIRKRSSEVWEVLGAVKTEFEKFEGVMASMQKHLNQTSSDLEDLMGRRTRAIARKLKNVQQLEDGQASELLPVWEEEGP